MPTRACRGVAVQTPHRAMSILARPRISFGANTTPVRGDAPPLTSTPSTAPAFDRNRARAVVSQGTEPGAMARSFLWTSEPIRVTATRMYYSCFSLHWFTVPPSVVGARADDGSDDGSGDGSVRQPPSQVARTPRAGSARVGSAAATAGLIVRVGDVVRCKVRNGERAVGLCLALVEQLWEAVPTPIGAAPLHQTKLRWFAQADDLPISKSRLPKQSQVCECHCCRVWVSCGGGSGTVGGARGASGRTGSSNQMG